MDVSFEFELSPLFLQHIELLSYKVDCKPGDYSLLNKICTNKKHAYFEKAAR